jgi:hypothetical protein
MWQLNLEDLRDNSPSQFSRHDQPPSCRTPDRMSTALHAAAYLDSRPARVGLRILIHAGACLTTTSRTAPLPKPRVPAPPLATIRPRLAPPLPPPPPWQSLPPKQPAQTGVPSVSTFCVASVTLVKCAASGTPSLAAPPQPPTPLQLPLTTMSRHLRKMCQITFLVSASRLLRASAVQHAATMLGHAP